MDFSFKVKYAIGQSIKYDKGIFKVVGYEYVKSRGIRYILLANNGLSMTREYLYDFEIGLLS